MKSGNPALSDKVFNKSITRSIGESMTLQGTINKTFILLALVFATAIFTWEKTMPAFGDVAPGAGSYGYVMAGVIGGLIFAIATIFKNNWAPITAPAYALFEGLALGAISAIYEIQYGGIVFQAIFLTFGICLALLLAYKSRIIKVTEKFRMGVVAATGGIFIVYMLSFVLSFFGVTIPYIHGSGLIGIGLSVFICIVASLNLVLDFDFIEKASSRGDVPKYMEWYGAFGLIVTLVWLYLEILRLLSKLNSRD
ncbi:MAG: Bax inhibitor-1/YccA family protein [Bacteriovoracaceae bacterium]|jgi:uncharacterized YccA/Bax inhibitor family protein|nr:Bax inhibitor-1/YccA family protein [Bacteriovoracaceae bacterium]